MWRPGPSLHWRPRPRFTTVNPTSSPTSVSLWLRRGEAGGMIGDGATTSSSSSTVNSTSIKIF